MHPRLHAFLNPPAARRAASFACAALVAFLPPTAAGATCFVEIDQLVASDTMPHDVFSTSVAASGNSLAVASPGNDETDQDAGAVYVLHRTGGRNGGYSEVAKLLAEDGGAGDGLGGAVGMSGSTIIANSAAYTAPGVRSGAAYVFERNAGGHDNWGQAAKLVGSGAGHNHGCHAVAIDGDVAVYGSAYWSGPVVGQSGTAYIFERDEWGDWVETHQVVPTGGVGQQQFGTGAALFGDTLVVGALAESSAAHQSGAVYLFERNAGGIDNWGQVAKLKAGDPNHRGFFGGGVAFDGETLVVAAVGDNQHGTLSGAAYVFEKNEQEEWVQVAKLTSPDPGYNQRFGGGVVVMGNVIHVGEFWDPSLGGQTGASFLFERDAEGQWNLARRFIGSETDSGDWFGWSATTQGNRLFVGARADELGGAQGGGALYVFESAPERDCD